MYKRRGLSSHHLLQYCSKVLIVCWFNVAHWSIIIPILILKRSHRLVLHYGDQWSPRFRCNQLRDRVTASFQLEGAWTLRYLQLQLRMVVELHLVPMLSAIFQTICTIVTTFTLDSFLRSVMNWLVNRTAGCMSWMCLIVFVWIICTSPILSRSQLSEIACRIRSTTVSLASAKELVLRS